MTSKFSVYLYIYDLSQGTAKALAPLLLQQQIDGIWHTGVVVYGKEYFFGSNGIQYVNPGGTVLGHTYKKLLMGHTEVPIDIFEDYLKELSVEKFRFDKYHLLNHNCNTFSNTVSNFLLHKNIPHHILDLPRKIESSQLGIFLKPILDNVYRGQRMFGPQGKSLADLPSSSSRTPHNPKSERDNNDSNNSDRDSDEESEQRRLTIERLLIETLRRYAEEEND